MMIRKVTYRKGEWTLRLSKEMIRHLGLVRGLEYVWVIFEDGGKIVIERVKDKIPIKGEIEDEESRGAKGDVSMEG